MAVLFSPGEKRFRANFIYLISKHHGRSPSSIYCWLDQVFLDLFDLHCRGGREEGEGGDGEDSQALRDCSQGAAEEQGDGSREPLFARAACWSLLLLKFLQDADAHCCSHSLRVPNTLAERG